MESRIEIAAEVVGLLHLALVDDDVLQARLRVAVGCDFVLEVVGRAIEACFAQAVLRSRSCWPGSRDAGRPLLEPVGEIVDASCGVRTGLLAEDERDARARATATVADAKRDQADLPRDEDCREAERSTKRPAVPQSTRATCVSAVSFDGPQRRHLRAARADPTAGRESGPRGSSEIWSSSAASRSAEMTVVPPAGTKNDGPPVSSMRHQGQSASCAGYTCIGSKWQALRRFIRPSSSCTHCSGVGRALSSPLLRKAASNRLPMFGGKSSSSSDAGGGSTSVSLGFSKTQSGARRSPFRSTDRPGRDSGRRTDGGRRTAGEKSASPGQTDRGSPCGPRRAVSAIAARAA